MKFRATYSSYYYYYYSKVQLDEKDNWHPTINYIHALFGNLRFLILSTTYHKSALRHGTFTPE